MGTEQDLINCAEHGEGYATYVCGHLVDDPVQEWFGDCASKENPWPDSWCTRCNAEFEREGEWNDKNEDSLHIKLACHHCYEHARAKSADRLVGDAFAAWSAFAGECCAFLHDLQDAFLRDYEIEKYERWDWYQDTGELIFSNNGVPEVIASFEFVGSLSTTSNTWLWAWANPSFSENVTSLIGKVREFGETQRFPRLTTPKWSAEEVDGWEMTSIAAYILDARGVYRTPGETGFTFLAITDIRRVEQ